MRDCTHSAKSERSKRNDPSGKTTCGSPSDFTQRFTIGYPFYSGITTVLPPNSPSCSSGGHQGWGIYSASSMHTGGCHVLMGDGAVRFVSENIDTGNLSAAQVTSGNSPYGIWGALGSMMGGETVGEF
ncbi:DUF1559 domain-containing protein [uncultured Gimesia sp.]|uniref:DUF1559 family PulG-like putative transporter n=1 Tax=uncultured Gimesia sp. TaxID=1678688 RepID=UPI0030D74DE5